MLRFILWLLFFYFLWRLLRVLIPFLQRAFRSTERKFEKPPTEGPPKAPFTFKDIKDADFKEIPNEPGPENSGRGSKNDGKSS